MILRQDNKEALLSEFDFVIDKLNESIPFDEKLFYYSALHGTVNRLLNLETTPQLVVLHHVLNAFYSAFNGRIQAMKAGDMSVKLDDNIFAKFVEYTVALRTCIREGTPPEDVYSKLICLAYVTTGNGYYLYVRGKLQP
jgi:hypothetical protein